ncbi:unnamed protein product, partial [Brassica rapa subsp. trilocularis]
GGVRLHVGGLGESVGRDDLLFYTPISSMGSVDTVEFVRTKGRSFAYIDFSEKFQRVAVPSLLDVIRRGYECRKGITRVAQGKHRLKLVAKSTEGSSWLQRASWTQLVSDKNASFSIAQLFPDLASDSREEARVNSKRLKAD